MPLGAIAAALYAISLVLPAIVAINKPLLWGSPRDESMLGIQCLLIGWWSVPWYANVLLGIATIGLEYRRPTLAIACSITAIGLALTTSFYLGAELRALHVGYFVWLASMVVVLVAACAGSVRTSTVSRSASPVDEQRGTRSAPPHRCDDAA